MKTFYQRCTEEMITIGWKMRVLWFQLQREVKCSVDV